MGNELDEVVESALRLSRAEREVLAERLRKSLEGPDVPGGIVAAPEDLVEFGARYDFPGNVRYRPEAVTLTATPGPVLPVKFGVAIADPWYPEAAPTYPATSFPAGEHPATLTSVTRTRADTEATESLPVAVSFGRLEEVARWQVLVDRGRQFHLDSDSSLGAFYEITDAAALQPAFEDSELMQDVFDRALEELIVPLERDGRMLAAAFLCGKDRHPGWQGFDQDGRAVAVLLDLGLLRHARGRAEL